ncbi:MAG TPA: tyrosine--tRNA ligase [Candidatus Paceibacterota bacterium]|nr:tyrosine--tRNA ligase [Candidatus Paceibacterota bacterium]
MLNFNRKVNTDKSKIERLLTKNVEDVFIKESIEKKLLSGKRLNIKLGFDPTGSKIHIGRAIILRKMREFQDLGHNIIFIVGNFTAQIGDPSDKIEKRPMLDKKQVEKNLLDYKKQIGKILDLKKVSFKYNNDWLSKLRFQEIAELAESFTVSQMIARRNFKERLEKSDEISLREFMYPLMQGYDSVMVDADIEIGGFDQLFNLKAGRIVQKHYNKKEQDILTTIMLEGTDGRKMSTSWGNVINITDEPNDMFGKVMSLKDELIIKYFRACTDVSESRIFELEELLKSQKINPRDAKKELAREIVKTYYDSDVAGSAESNFEKTFSHGGIPENILETESVVGKLLADVLFENKIIDSKGDWRRLIDGGAVSIIENSEKISDPNYKIEKTATYRIGKKRFIKISV